MQTVHSLDSGKYQYAKVCNQAGKTANWLASPAQESFSSLQIFCMNSTATEAHQVLWPPLHVSSLSFIAKLVSKPGKVCATD